MDNTIFSLLFVDKTSKHYKTKWLVHNGRLLVCGKHHLMWFNNEYKLKISIVHKHISGYYQKDNKLTYLGWKWYIIRRAITLL
jgi:hypothetical protein